MIGLDGDGGTTQTTSNATCRLAGGGLTTDKLLPPGSRQSDSSTSGIANDLIRTLRTHDHLGFTIYHSLAGLPLFR